METRLCARYQLPLNLGRAGSRRSNRMMSSHLFETFRMRFRPSYLLTPAAVDGVLSGVRRMTPPTSAWSVRSVGSSRVKVLCGVGVFSLCRRNTRDWGVYPPMGACEPAWVDVNVSELGRVGSGCGS